MLPGFYVPGSDSTPDLAWGLQRLGIQACSERRLTGAGVRFGHLDIGVDGAHPALRRHVSEFVARSTHPPRHKTGGNQAYGNFIIG